MPEWIEIEQLWPRLRGAAVGGDGRRHRRRDMTPSVMMMIMCVIAIEHGVRCVGGGAECGAGP
jgi:hypothetical protein